jgi:phenylacetate-CoA ligase
MAFPVRRRIYESLPTVLKRPVRLVPFAWIAGPAYREVMAREPLFERASREEILAYQERALGEMLEFATTRVPAYGRHRPAVERHRPFEALKDFPLLSKSTVRENLRDYLPVDLDRIPHYEISTAGTTGESLRLFVDDASQSVELGFVHRLWRRVGYSPRHRKARFRGGSFRESRPGVYWQLNPIYNEIQFSPFHMSESTMGLYVDRLIRYAPSYLHGYPSAVDLMAEYVLRNELSPSLPPIRAALLASEGCSVAQRERIAEAFRTRVFPLYGHSERLLMAGECEVTDTYHHFPDYGILEIVAEGGTSCEREGEQGELVGTGLLNRSMVLIRYRTGDHATRAAPSCACGRAWDRFTDIRGRRNHDVLAGKAGVRIPLTALTLHRPVFERVARYQYHQSEPGRVTLRVVAAPGFSESDRSRIESAYRGKLGGEIDFSVEVVDDIPLTARGKLKVLVTDVHA